ncbi:MAG: response regulator transcription factor [Chloroflexi bacterium]|nr:response regulator transcription factor [Chloroflexota bacterium]
MDDLRVLIVAADPLARAGLTALLSSQPGCTVVGQVADDADLTADLETFRPDVVLWDLGFDTTAALENLSDMPEGSPPLVALLPDESHASEVWTAGALGLLFRNADAASLIAALGAVASGIVAVDPQLASSMMTARVTPLPPTAGGLTPREAEVLTLMAEGLPNKSIALQLGISDHTVKFHVNSILGKLNAQSRTEAVMQATRLGYILL